MKRIFTLIIITAMASIFCSCSAKKPFDNSTVPAFDLTKYLGTWYEIARYDHRFERGIDYATAQYVIMNNGKVKVLNSGKRGDDYSVANGRAKITETPGLLRVSFFGPFFSDYRVMMVSPDYKYALVGSKSQKYLWILSRTPQVPGNVLDAILAEAVRRGYDTERLIWVKQVP